jgi:hypothetical protein
VKSLIRKSGLTKSGYLDIQLPEGFQLSPGQPDEKWQALSKDHWQRPIQLPALQTRVFKVAWSAGRSAAQTQGNIRVWVTDAQEQQVRMSEVPVTPLKVVNLDTPASEPASSTEPEYPEAAVGCSSAIYYVSGELVVTEERRFENRFSRFVMAPGAGIRVKPGGQLHLRNALFTACDGHWKGIVVEEGGVLTIDNTVIEQALHPVLYENRTARQGNLHIYPNPASDKVYFQFSTTEIAPAANPGQIMLTDPVGRVYSVQANSTAQSGLFEGDILSLPAGMYHATLILPDGASFTGEMMIARN